MSPLSYSVKGLKNKTKTKQNRNKFAFKVSILYLDQHNKKQGKQITDEDGRWHLGFSEVVNLKIFAYGKGKTKNFVKFRDLKSK